MRTGEVMAKTKQKKPAKSSTRSETIRALRAQETPEERSERARRSAASRTPEQRAESARKAGLASAAKRAAKKTRREAALKGWETKRRENPERYPTPEPKKKKKRTQAEIDAANRARSLKGAETKRRRAAEAKFRRENWTSESTFIIREGFNIGAAVREIIEAIQEDAAAAGAKLLTQPWRVVGGVEGSESGAASFDVTLDGTIHERAAALAVVIADALDRGEIKKRDTPTNKAAGSKGGGRAARAMDAAAQRERERALAEFADKQGQRLEQSARVSVLASPPGALTWQSQPEPEDEDLEDAPF